MPGKKQENDKAREAGRLRAAGLRPTRQRIALAGLLFRHGNRHVSAEKLHEEALAAGCEVSLATVYNTLHQFTDVGLLRQVIAEPGRGYFDTNTADHQHFYDSDHGQLIDIPGQTVSVAGIPQPPKGTQVERVDVVIRLRHR